jgi:hypothetical protein
MRAFVALIIIAFIIPSSFAAVATMKVTAQGTGSIVMNSDRTWESGDDLQRVNSGDQYNGGTSGNILLTAPGDFRYQTSDKLDATVNNRYNRTDYYKFDNGGIFSNSLSMTDNTPNLTPVECTAGNLGSVSSQAGTPDHQTASAEFTGLLQSAEVDSASFVNDANLSIGQHATFGGAGMYIGDSGFDTEVGGSNASRTMNYRNSGKDHLFASTNTTGYIDIKPEFSYTDFSDAFVTNQTGEAANTTENQTVNQT